MIFEYHRPHTIDEALRLLARPEPRTLPLAGGSALNKPSAKEIAVVDLQALGLNTLEWRGNFLDLGATLTLQELLDRTRSGVTPGLALQPELEKVIHLEATYNQRQVATVAGALVASDGRSPITTALLALDAMLVLQPGMEIISLGELLPFRAERLRGKLITGVTIPLNPRIAFERIARTPADLPIVCVAVAIWPSGRTRVALGGFGGAALLALDGTEAAGSQIAARSVYSQADDEWATAEYRQAMADILTTRCIERLQ